MLENRGCFYSDTILVGRNRYAGFKIKKQLCEIKWLHFKRKLLPGSGLTSESRAFFFSHSGFFRVTEINSFFMTIH